MKEKAYIIPKKSRLFIAAAVCMLIQFAAHTVLNMIYIDNHIPFFGNLYNDFFLYFGFENRFFVEFLIDDVLYFASCVLPVVGVLLARKNLWVLSIGWICYLLVMLRQYFTTVDSGFLSLVLAACAGCAAFWCKWGRYAHAKPPLSRLLLSARCIWR